ncbi:MAG: winged helix-turn-helix transcriptional regulator [Candidatus Verstraetearchaeota archaeon]|nr:winged helix-turn-helix transcriptional regulator [Candidatus Verstraetearchaeota archaeon]
MSEIEKVKEVLKQNPQGLSSTKIAELAGISKGKITKVMKELESSGEVIIETKGCRKIYKPKA